MSMTELAKSIDGGELRLEIGVAEKCAAACSELLEVMDRALPNFQQGDWSAAFGDFRSGRTVAAKYVLLASGTDRSFDRVLQDHRNVIADMRDLFLAAGKAYREAEVQNVAAFGSVGESLGG